MERLIRPALDDVAGDRDGVIRIRGRCARAVDLHRHVRDQVIAMRHRRPARAEQVLERFFEASGVREDAPERDRLREIARNLEVEVFGHIAVEIELVTFTEFTIRLPRRVAAGGAA